MEFKQVVGRRRSIRYYLPYRPVERDKIQTILEASRLSSRAVNADFAKAIVVNREDMSEEERDSLKTPTTTTQLDLAPVWIFWFGDPTAPKVGKQSLKQLVDAGALTPSHGWSYAYVDDVVWPQVLSPIMADAGISAVVMAVEAGLTICQALLAAVDEGLGTQLTALNGANAAKILGTPEHWIPLWIQLVGYPAESPEAGGQRPRYEPWEDVYHEGRYGRPFKRDEKVVQRLRDAGMITREAPFPWRKEEIRALANMFGLPE